MTTEEYKSNISGFGVLFLYLMLFPTLFLDAWVLVRLWRWFALPVFPALPALSVLTATGIIIVVRFVVSSHISQAELKEEFKWQQLLYRPTATLLTLSIGWIVHLWIIT